MSDIIEQLKASRKSKKISQGDLGKRMKLPQSHISNIESGQTDTRLSTVVEMSRQLDHELMLIPKEWIMAVQHIVAGHPEKLSQPKWRIMEEEDE